MPVAVLSRFIIEGLESTPGSRARGRRGCRRDRGARAPVARAGAHGRALHRAAVDAGYHRAFSAILDSNVTTVIAAVVLFQFGSGPVKGFAVTLSIGIAVSMFTAIFVTRVIFETVFRLRQVTKFSI